TGGGRLGKYGGIAGVADHLARRRAGFVGDVRGALLGSRSPGGRRRGRVLPLCLRLAGRQENQAGERRQENTHDTLLTGRVRPPPPGSPSKGLTGYNPRRATPDPASTTMPPPHCYRGAAT